MDPHNRDPPSDCISTGPSFNISSSYGTNGHPPECIVQVLADRRDAFSFDGRPGLVDSVRIPINTDYDMLFPSPRPVGPHKRQVIDASINQLLD